MYITDGVRVEYDTRRTVDGRGLQIEGVVKSDEGTYRCVATNEGGTKESEAALTIQGM